MTDAGDIRDSPSIEQAIAGLVRAIDATDNGVLPRIGDMVPALKVLSETQLGLSDVKAQKQQDFEAVVRIENELTRAGHTRREIPSIVQERLDISRTVYYEHRKLGLKLGLIPAESAKSGLNADDLLLES